MEGKGSYRLTQTRAFFWGYIWILVIVLLTFRLYSPSAHTFEHTYQTSTPPGTLSSQRWGWDFVSESFYVLAWLIPMTAAFMVDAPVSRGRRTFHLAVLVLLCIWFTVQLVWSSVDWSKANDFDPGNFYNPFNDDRWCSIYFALPGAPCVNIVAFVPGVGAGDLNPNPVALYRFWFNVVLLVAVVLDFALTMTMFRNAVQMFLTEFDQQNAEPLLQSKVGGRYKGRQKKKPTHR